MTRRNPPGAKRADPGPLKADDAAIFRSEMRGVAPAPPTNRIERWREPPPPVPAKRREDEQAVLDELGRLAFEDDGGKHEDDGTFLRPGLPRDILRKLRATHWEIQEDLDLHGMSGEEAALATARFLAECQRLGLRCVRIVHGKGLRSPGRAPVLKRRIRTQLMRRDDVLAYVEPRAGHGGGGAVVVLLKA